jgi:transcriptional regulator with XRE-family HTH domain
MSGDIDGAVADFARVAYITAAGQEMGKNQILGSDLAAAGGADTFDKPSPRPTLTTHEAVDGRRRTPDPIREAGEGKVVSLAVALDRMGHAGFLPKRQEKSKPLYANRAIVHVLPGWQNLGMPKGRPKTAPISAINRVYELRTRDNLTQAQLGEKAGCSGGQIAKIESGSRRITEPMLFRLAKALNVKPAEIYSTDPRHENPHEEEAARLVRLMPPEQREAWLNMGAAILRPQAPAGQKLRKA